MTHVRLNLRGVTSLIVDRDHFTRSLVAQMIRGFGMEGPTLVDSAAAAKEHLRHSCVDLCIMEAVLPDAASPELISWIRRQNKPPLCFIPIIVLSGYTQLRMVNAARDAGANFVVRKPVSPQGLFDRIAWVARADRPFIETGTYMGPDRRFLSIDPPDNARKRSGDDCACTAEHDGALLAPNGLVSALKKGGSL